MRLYQVVRVFLWLLLKLILYLELGAAFITVDRLYSMYQSRSTDCDRNRMANLSKASNVVQEKYILYDVLYDVTSFTEKWHSIPFATNCIAK